mgnify:FL=1
MKKRNELAVLMIVGVFFLLASSISESSEPQDRNISIISEENEIKEIKASGHWVLTCGITIEGPDGWISVNSTYDWCNGSGTIDRPYIIENLTINAQGSGSCMRIRNSEVYFIIRNCTFTGSGSNTGNAGIYLYNVINGIVENNTIYNNGENGIYITFYPSTIIIRNNTIDNNDRYGIYIGGCEDCEIIDNKITRNQEGIYICFESHNPYSNVIENNTISNNDFHGIELDTQCRSTIIKNNTISGNGYDGIYIYVNGDEIEILNNTIISNGRHGIYLSYDSDSNIISGNDIHGNSDTGLRFYSYSSATVSYNNISENAYSIWLERSYGSNIFSNHLGHKGIILRGSESRFMEHTIATSNKVNNKSIYYYFGANGLTNGDFTDPGQILLVNCNNSHISNQNISLAPVGLGCYFSVDCDIFNNSIQDCEQGIDLYKLNNSLIHNNTLSYNNHGLYGEYCKNNTLVNNTGSLNQVGINMENSPENLITHNFVWNNTQYGISVYGDSNNFTFNKLGNNSYGIRICGQNMDIVNNTANNNDWGIYICYASQYNIIVNNTLINNTQSGIEMVDETYNNTIAENKLEGNHYGIYVNCEYPSFSDIRDNNISYNLIKRNDYGIYFNDQILDHNIVNNTFQSNVNYGVYIEQSSCSGNLFYNNSFINNGINARSVGTNYWNNSKIGNYWDDYTGYDSNGDGIGEIPYTENGVDDQLPICSEIDTVAPIIVENNIIDGDFYGPVAPLFNLEITEFSINQTWYRLWNGTVLTTNKTFTYNEGVDTFIDPLIWNQVGNGTVIISFYANDSNGNWNFLNITIFKDIIAPIIYINQPETDETFGETAPFFEINIEETNNESAWYTIDDDAVNYTLTGLSGQINQSAWGKLNDGPVLLQFYANDSAGNIAANSTLIHKTANAHDQPGSFDISTDAEDPDMDGLFRINWTESEGADNYSIYWHIENISPLNIGEAHLIANGLTNRSMKIPQMADGTYYFIVLACNESGSTLSANLIIVVEIETEDEGSDDDDDDDDSDAPAGNIGFLPPIEFILLISGMVMILVIVVRFKLNPLKENLENSHSRRPK